MNEILGKYFYLTFTAEGYHSGSRHTETLFITESLASSLRDVDNWVDYVAELDGKHSEVAGDFALFPINTKDDLRVAAETYLDDDGYDHIADFLDNEFSINRDWVVSCHNDVAKHLKAKVTCSYWFAEEEL